MGNSELYHYGVLGMRWGVRRFKAQLRTSNSSASKKVKGKISDTSKKEPSEVDVDMSSEERIKQRKAEILRSRSAKQLYDNADLFSNKELTDAYVRLNTERNIKNMVPENVSKGKKYVDKLIENGKKVNEIVDVTTKLYDNYKKIEKMLGDSKASKTK